MVLGACQAVEQPGTQQEEGGKVVLGA